MSTPTTLKLPDELKDRIARLAKAAGITPHAFMVQALGAQAELAERRREFVAAALAADEGIEVEVIDLRSLVPWDRDLVASSVRRTGRLLVVHEDVVTCGFGAEVAAWGADALFADLRAPVRRVGALDTHVAYEPGLEDVILPQTADVAAAAAALLAHR